MTEMFIRHSRRDCHARVRKVGLSRLANYVLYTAQRLVSSTRFTDEKIAVHGAPMPRPGLHDEGLPEAYSPPPVRHQVRTEGVGSLL